MKNIIFTLLLLFSLGFINANPVSKEFAGKIAVNYYMHYAPKEIMDYSVKNIIDFQYENVTTFYAFEFTSGGFVLVSADNATIPVLGYSFQGQFVANNLPSNVSGWFDSYSKEIKYIIDSQIENSATLIEWNNILQNKYPKLLLSVSPLLSTTWDQGCNYNALCPTDAAGPCSHVWAGCVATAMAQIMNYWEWPVTGSGSYSYYDSNYGTQSANFGTTTYNWSAMPNNVTSSNTAVATLLKHCGVSVDMSYGWDGSGAYSSSIPDALFNYFGYQPTAIQVIQDDYSYSDWTSLLQSELDASRPIEYSGQSGSGGHAFVCDGYDNSGYFHFNWGWSGSDNGYYYIGSLNPGGYSFDYDNAAIIQIIPSNVNPALDCNNAINLTCGQTYNGTTVGGNSNVTTYDCQTWDESGPEKVHIISSGGGNITATLSNLNSDLDVFILGSCSASDCKTSGDLTASITGAAAGTYYIVVDGFEGASGTYTLNVTCTSPALNCSGAIDLTCGQNYNGNTVGGNSNASLYSGTTWNESGPEKVHKITTTSPRNLKATLSNMSADLDIFILSSCNTLACQQSADNEAIYTNAPAGTYYFVVDGFEGASGSYTLNVTCESGVGIDDFSDNPINIYPNPALNYIYVETFEPLEDGIITISNLQGQIILQKSIFESKTEIDISQLSQGIYFIKLSARTGLILRKFVKE